MSSIRLETDDNDVDRRPMTLHDSNKYMLEHKMSCDVIIKIMGSRSASGADRLMNDIEEEGTISESSSVLKGTQYITRTLNDAHALNGALTPNGVHAPNGTFSPNGELTPKGTLSPNCAHEPNGALTPNGAHALSSALTPNGANVARGPTPDAAHTQTATSVPKSALSESVAPKPDVVPESNVSNTSAVTLTRDDAHTSALAHAQDVAPQPDIAKTEVIAALKPDIAPKPDIARIYSNFLFLISEPPPPEPPPIPEVAHESDVPETHDADPVNDIISVPERDVSQPVEAKVPAHMYVLRARCPKLAARAVSQPTGQSGSPFVEQINEVRPGRKYEIELDDMTVDVLTELLRFLYYEKVQLTISNVFGVLYAARTYIVPLLASISIKYIQSIISVKTVCRVLQQSLKYGEEALSNVCTEFISRNTESVLNDASFLRTNEQVVDIITSLDYLTINEVDLFSYCVQWARNSVTRSDSTLRGGGRRRGAGELVGAELRRALGGVISNNRIRFPAMELEEFCQTVVRLDVLNDAETVEVYNYLACPGRNKPATRYIVARRHGQTVSRQQDKNEPITEWYGESSKRATTPPGMSSTVFRSVFFHW